MDVDRSLLVSIDIISLFEHIYPCRRSSVRYCSVLFNYYSIYNTMWENWIEKNIKKLIVRCPTFRLTFEVRVLSIVRRCRRWIRGWSERRKFGSAATGIEMMVVMAYERMRCVRCDGDAKTTIRSDMLKRNERWNQTKQH